MMDFPEVARTKREDIESCETRNSVENARTEPETKEEGTDRGKLRERMTLRSKTI